MTPESQISQLQERLQGLAETQGYAELAAQRLGEEVRALSRRLDETIRRVERLEGAVSAFAAGQEEREP